MSGYEFEQFDKSAFNETIVAELSSIIHLQWPYGINSRVVNPLEVNGGTVTQVDKQLNVATAASTNNSAIMLSRDILKYNAGQGAVTRFTARFTAGVAGNTQLIGVGNAADGLFFGFDGTSFGVLRRRGGEFEVRTLTITTASSTAENITVTLDGVADATVAVTASGDTSQTAYEIANHDYKSLGNTGWVVKAIGNTVVFVSIAANATQTGTYSIAGTTVVGSFAQTLAGISPEDNWTPQTTWNEDKFDGTGSSGITLDKTKGNVYQVRYQWLGFGQITFYIENPDTGVLELCHAIKYANQNILTSIDNPTLPMHVSSINTTNDTVITINSGSMSAFVEGKEEELGPTFGADNLMVETTTNEVPVLAIQSKLVFINATNRVRIKPVFLNFSSNLKTTGSSNTIFRLYSDPTTLTGAVFTDVATDESTISADTSSTAFTGGNIIGTIILGHTESIAIPLFEAIFRTAAATTLLITSEISNAHAQNEVGATINWRELF